MTKPTSSAPKKLPGKPVNYLDKEKDFTVKVTIALSGYGNPDKERRKMLNSITNILKLYFEDNVVVRYNGKPWEPE